LRILNLIVVVITGMVLVYGTLDMPDWGDPTAPASRHVSPYYIANTVEQTSTPNIVTSVLADYRGYDTLGETTVIFSAGIACILILKRKRKKQTR
jgi:multicomponent Na+:H+ antiporter subunit B